MRIKWSDEQNEQIRRVYNRETDETIRTLTRRWGVSQCSVTKQAQRLGLVYQVGTKSSENRQCASCGYPLAQHEDEHRDRFIKRMTCRNDACQKDLRKNGRRFPEYRETRPAEVKEMFRKVVFNDQRLLLSRLPRFLWPAVEKSVENPLTY